MQELEGAPRVVDGTRHEEAALRVAEPNLHVDTERCDALAVGARRADRAAPLERVGGLGDAGRALDAERAGIIG